VHLEDFFFKMYILNFLQKILKILIKKKRQPMYCGVFKIKELWLGTFIGSVHYGIVYRICQHRPSTQED